MCGSRVAGWLGGCGVDDVDVDVGVDDDDGRWGRLGRMGEA